MSPRDVEPAGAPEGRSEEPTGAGSAAGSSQGVRRRNLLLGGAAAGVGALAAAGTQLVGGAPSSSVAAETPDNGAGTVPFFGPRQAGIGTAAQAHGAFVALDLKPGIVAAGVKSLLKLLTSDAARLTQGEGALADTEAELAFRPANLTVTFGFGPGLFRVAAPGRAPSWLRPLPKFGIDRLVKEFSGGDLLLQICADDPLTVAHAQRMLLKDSRSFTTVRWVQQGFRRAYGTEKPGTTMRNLFGQVDGTANPAPGSESFERVVFGDGTNRAWVENGTSLVIRRISMNLDKWDELDRSGREESVGRKLSNGAPLTGVDEHDEPDFKALNPVGFPVIADFSHLRRARPEDPSQRIFRRAFNYDVPPGGPGVSDSGLLFASFQADVDRQFVPIQKRLDDLDILNQWTTPVGSAVFAIPPGCGPDGFVGEGLFASA
ncbi:peroxidase [Arthrobacter woluwensis]|uniref:Dyp-type peroxidase n=1 Tax=Arthrobacter woluwensis TaxID=156980 RepID=UPI000D129562|nr:Dyp-type peroxidase [Arthrobacter woluwensis]PSS43666.1 peroxidase [Arthrobacter woluwensis]